MVIIFCPLAPSDSNKKTKPSQSDDDDIASLSRRINQATYSDDSTSLLDDNDESDASRDVNSMAEGDLADMEDNDITTSMIDGEETGNDLSNYLDSNSNVNKGMLVVRTSMLSFSSSSSFSSPSPIT